MFIPTCFDISVSSSVSFNFFFGSVILTALILRTYVTWRDTKISKLPEDDTEMSKHVGVNII